MQAQQLSMFDNDEISDIHKLLQRGSLFSGSQLRIYAAEQLLDADRFEEFLSDEFGVGGGTSAIKNGCYSYNSRGIVIDKWSDDKKYKYTWRKIASIYRDMIARGLFPGEEVIRQYMEARKAGKGAPLPQITYWKDE